MQKKSHWETQGLELMTHLAPAVHDNENILLQYTPKQKADDDTLCDCCG